MNIVYKVRAKDAHLSHLNEINGLGDLDAHRALTSSPRFAGSCLIFEIGLRW